MSKIWYAQGWRCSELVLSSTLRAVADYIDTNNFRVIDMTVYKDQVTEQYAITIMYEASRWHIE